MASSYVFLTPQIITETQRIHPRKLQNKSWADDVDEFSSKTDDIAARITDTKDEDFIDENGVRTTIEYIENEDGKRVKVSSTFVYLLVSILIFVSAPYLVTLGHSPYQANTSKICRRSCCG